MIIVPSFSNVWFTFALFCLHYSTKTLFARKMVWPTHKKHKFNVLIYAHCLCHITPVTNQLRFLNDRLPYQYYCYGIIFKEETVD